MPQPAVPPGDPALILGRPNGVENFENANNWTTFDSECFSSKIYGGYLVMTANGMPTFSCWEFTWPRLDNFYVETILEMPASCQSQDRFGLIFRAPDTNRGYLYGYNCAGEYSLTIWDGEQTTTLVPSRRNIAILTGKRAVNRMGLMVFGENISLYANGVYLQTITDSTYLDAGRIGYFVRTATEEPFTVRYDQLRVWALEDELYPPSLAQRFPPIDLPNPGGSAISGEARVNVNVRTGPSTLFPILRIAQQGDIGEILGINPDGSWYAVRVPTNLIGTGTAWVSADFVNLINPSGRPLHIITPPLLPRTIDVVEPPSSAPQVLMTEAATIRSGPTPEFPVFGVAPMGSRAEVIGQSKDGGWWAIRVPTTVSKDGTAWVWKVFTSAVSTGNPVVVSSPALSSSITPAAPSSGAPALIVSEPQNVYSGPGEPYQVLGSVGVGSVLPVVGISPDREWFVVNIPTTFDPSGQGWINSRSTSSQNTGSIPVIQPPPQP